MKTSLWTIGSTKSPLYSDIIEAYNERLDHYLKYNYREISTTTKGTAEEVKKGEGEKILEKLDPQDVLIIWDVEGKQLTSEKFAEFMQDKMISGKNLCFLIGGAYGFDRELKKRANHSFSLSKMTFNHQMVRIIVLEQIYRAMTILQNEPYHNG